MIDKNDILKNKPDYEEYTENEVKLTVEEMKEFGLLKGGCCGKNNGSTSGNCSNCCKKKIHKR